MKIEIIRPESCDKCPFFQLSKDIHQCKYYNKGFYTVPGNKPDYCKVESIVVNEIED